MDAPLDSDVFQLISLFLSGGSGAFRNVDPKLCVESLNLYESMKKFAIKQDSPEETMIALKRMVSDCPLLVTSVLHRTSGKVAEVYGKLNGLPVCLAFPWGINLIPTTPEWEPLRVLWKMWKESYTGFTVARSPKGEYMQLNYSVTDWIYSRESIMLMFDIEPPSLDYVLMKIEVTLDKFGYGDSYAAFEIIFASSAPDIWNFYESHSRRYSYVNFYDCPETVSETTDAAVLDLRKSEHNPPQCVQNLPDRSEQQKPNGHVTIVCFNEYKDLKALQDLIASSKKKSEQESKANNRTHETIISDDSEPKGCGSMISPYVCARYAGRKSDQKVDASRLHGGSDAITAREKSAPGEIQMLTSQPTEVSNKSKGTKQSQSDSESKFSGYRMLREAVAQIDNEKTSIFSEKKTDGQKWKGRHSAFRDGFNSDSRAAVIRDIVRKYFIRNPPPQNFSSVSSAWLVFPELPILQSYIEGFQPYLDMFDSLLDVPQSWFKEVKEMPSSRGCVTKVEQHDVFIKPKLPAPRKKAFEKESSRQKRVNNCSFLETNRQHAGSKAKQNNGPAKSLELVRSRDSGTKKDSFNEKGLSDRRQGTEDRDRLCSDSLTGRSGGDSLQKNCFSGVFRAGCSGDSADTGANSGPPERVVRKHPENQDLKRHPLPEKAGLEGFPSDLRLHRDATSKFVDATCPSRSRTCDTLKFKKAALPFSPDDRSDATCFETRTVQEKSRGIPGKSQKQPSEVGPNPFGRSTKRLNDSDDPKLSSFRDDGFSQTRESKISGEWQTRSSDDHQILLAIRKFLPRPPVVVRSNYRQLSRQALNVMRARAARNSSNQHLSNRS